MENIIYTLVEADFNFADGDGNALATVNIKTLPVDGNLTLNDIAVNVDQAIAVADINNNLFKFTPTADENGAPYTNFTFTVTDDNAVNDANEIVDNAVNYSNESVVSREPQLESESVIGVNDGFRVRGKIPIIVAITI